VVVVDEWKSGMNILVEFNSIPEQLTSGWSLKIQFDPPLGVNANIESWSNVLTSSTLEKDGLTLVNTAVNGNVSKLTNIRTSFIVDHIEPFAHRKVFVGLYNHRILKLDCYLPDESSMKSLKMLPSIIEESKIIDTTTSKPTTTVATTLKPTTTNATTLKPTTTEATTLKPTKTIATTSNSSATTLKSTTTIATTSNSTIKATNKPKTTETPTTVKTTEKTTTTTEKLKQILTQKIDGNLCKLQKVDPYTARKGWTQKGYSYYSALAKVTVTQSTSDWTIGIIFGTPIDSIEVWNTNLGGTDFEGRLWKFRAHNWNKNLKPGKFEMSFNARVEGLMALKPNARVYLCSSSYTSGDPIYDFDDESKFIYDTIDDSVTQSGEETPVVTIEGSEDSDNSEESDETSVDEDDSDVTTSTPIPKTARCKSTKTGSLSRKPKQTKPKWKKSKDGTLFDYNEVLQKSILFYEAQRAGKISKVRNRIPWRSDSTLRDGCDVGIDLSGGWFDAGDTVKFTFPMAATLTNLAWGGIVYQDAYKDSDALSYLFNSLRWATTYLIRAHPKRYELIVMVGDPKKDHSFWGRPEELNMKRPAYKIDKKNPGSEVAGETAAALAAASILFEKTYSKLSRAALRHAKGLFEFATKYRGDYHVAVPLVKDFYKSWSGYKDELLWAAAWLYKATNNNYYLQEARKIYDEMSGQYLSEKEISWDRKMVSAQVLLANITGEDIFRTPITRFMDNVMAMPKTPEGIMYLNPWAPNRYAANAAMIAIMASELSPPLPRSVEYFKWGEDQIHRIMGGKGGRSYIIGIGKNYPKRPHHRSSSCPFPPASCTFSQLHSSQPNPITLYGALVGGPGLKGKFTDDRNDYRQNEVALDYNAGFQTAIAGLKFAAIKNRQ